MGAGREEQWGGREAGRMGVVAQLVEVHKLHSPHHSPARPRYREGDRFDAVNWIENKPCLASTLLITHRICGLAGGGGGSRGRRNCGADWLARS